jgi:predicted flap endonuclease-1-like 5' DNA nuclease
MKSVLLFFLMIAAAVLLGLAIAFWYLSRFDDRSRVRKPARAEPFPDKHPPVDLTPTSPDLVEHQAAASGASDNADIDGLMRRVGMVKAAHDAGSDAEAAPASDTLPQALSSSPDRERDDLKRISGIGPKLEGLLNTNGIFRFRQIAEWQESDVQAMDKLLPAFHGRIQREDWVGQARELLDA